MFTYRKFLLTFFIIFLPIVLALSQIQLFIGDYVFTQIDAEGDYLESLKNNTEFGCSTLLVREPELLLIGNSGSYTYWDMRQLQSMTGLKVGGCMIGGASIETIELILGLVERLDRPPKHIILGASIHSFLKPKNYVLAMDNQKQFILNAHFPYQFLLKMAWKKLRAENNYPFLMRDIDRAIMIHRNLLVASEEAIEKLIKTQKNSILNTAIKMNTLEHFDNFSKYYVDRICSKIKSINTKLWVINIPTSPMIEAVYENDLLQYYKTSLSNFDECAEKIITFDSSYYGLKNLYYVNRFLNKYPYENWRSGHDIDPLIDVDHPNPFGAEKFTTSAVQLLFGDGKNLDLNGHK
jgi:hypothetical protein